MTSWQFQSPLVRLQQRAFLLAEIRQFFGERGVMEVATPIISSAANTDQQIEVFATDAIHPDKQQAYLRTSPEFFHKRLLASGSGDIFEIAPVFRRGEVTRLHNPEFTLLEWYRLGFDMSDLMAEMDALFQLLARRFNLLVDKTQLTSYQSLFKDYVEIDPFNVTDSWLNEFCHGHGYRGSNLSRTGALDFIFSILIQPQLVDLDGLLVFHFPIEQAALAQTNPDNPKTCLRFEFLFRGIELANGYQELQDVEQQRKRFENDLKWRQQHHKNALPLDEHLLSALDSGLPACSGVAVGIERLHMCLIQAEDIKEVLGFHALNS